MKIRALLFAAVLSIFFVPQAAKSQPQIPLQISQFFQSLNIPASEWPALYHAMLGAMATGELSTYFTELFVQGVGPSGLAQPIGQAARVQIMETLVGGWSAMEAAALERLRQAAQTVAGTKDAAVRFAQLIGDRSTWGRQFIDIYNKLGGARYSGTVGRGGFVSLPVLLGTVTAVVAGTTGYVAGKAILKQQDLQVKAAETQAYQTTVANLVKSLQAGRTHLLPGLSQQAAIERILRNMDAGLPPYSDVLEVRPAPNIAGSWQGDLVVKDVQGQSNIAVGQKRTVTGGQFQIEQDENEVTLIFGGNRIRGYFVPPDFLEGRYGQQRSLTVVDNVKLLEPLGGTVTRVELGYYSGADAGSLAGQLKVELEQRSQSATIVSGGMLKRP